MGDEVVDRFCVIGPVEEHLRKLAELADAGVDQFNIYLMNGDDCNRPMAAFTAGGTAGERSMAGGRVLFPRMPMRYEEDT